MNLNRAVSESAHKTRGSATAIITGRASRGFNVQFEDGSTARGILSHDPEWEDGRPVTLIRVGESWQIAGSAGSAASVAFVAPEEP